jgi:hypothetical protein
MTFIRKKEHERRVKEMMDAYKKHYDVSSYSFIEPLLNKVDRYFTLTHA